MPRFSITKDWNRVMFDHATHWKISAPCKCVNLKLCSPRTKFQHNYVPEADKRNFKQTYYQTITARTKKSFHFPFLFLSDRLS